MNEQELYNTIYKGMEPLKEIIDCYEVEPLTGMNVIRPDKREYLFKHLVATMTKILIHEKEHIKIDQVAQEAKVVEMIRKRYRNIIRIFTIGWGVSFALGILFATFLL